MKRLKAKTGGSKRLSHTGWSGGSGYLRRGTRRKGERFGYLRRGTRRKGERFESVRGECEILKL